MADQSAARSHPSTGTGMLLCILAMALFAIQDAIAKTIVATYPISQFLLVRYWIFVVGVVIYVSRSIGLRRALASKRPFMQVVRSVLVASETFVFIWGLQHLGLAEAHAIFAVSPLLATGLAGLLLREQIGWRRSLALITGFAGAMLIIKPGMQAFNIAAFIPLTAALMFAFYNIITRYTGLVDPYQTSLLYMSVVGAAMMTPIGLAQWVTPEPLDLAIMILAALFAISAHMLLMKSLQLAPASMLQPFNYLLLVGATVIGIGVFGERPDIASYVGGAMVVGSGLFTLFREQYLARRRAAEERSRPQG